MRRVFVLLIALAIAPAFGCAKRVARPAGVAPGTPYISWIVMHGDRDNPDREFSCQSDARSDCWVPVSRPDAQVFSDVHVYYHGAGAETKYAGTLQIGFFQGGEASRNVKTAVTVKKDESLTNEAVTGIVTSTPGHYTLAFAFDASVGGGRGTQPFHDQVSVEVR
jgi:hypothetical protein